jgi:SAM-dependent methyltransferase
VLLGRDELWARLSPRAEEARSAFRAAVGVSGPDGALPRPQVWADPRLTLLAPFWAAVLGVPATVVHVHRRPGSQAADLVAAGGLDEVRALEIWDQVNRAALALWEERTGMVFGIETLEDEPDAALGDVMALLATLDVHPTDDERAAARKVVDAAPPLPRHGGPDVPNRYEVLHRVLSLSGGTGALDAEAVVGALAGYYDEDYYEHYGSADGAPYRPGVPEWEAFFGSVAAHIADELCPTTVLDAGCAVGFLVAALHDRGVVAHGVDVSAWAIGQVPERVRSRVRIGSLTEELDDRYDLITCIEVIEHLPDAVADQVVRNLTRHAGAVLFSSTPDGFDEVTHINVQPPAHWAGLFAAHGFVRHPGYDASYVSPGAVLFVPGDTGVDAVLARYEEALWRTTSRMGGQVAEWTERAADRLARCDELEGALVREAEESTRLRNGQRDHDLAHNAEVLGLSREILDARREADDRGTALSTTRSELGDVQDQLEAARRSLPMRLRSSVGRAVRRMRHTR